MRAALISLAGPLRDSANGTAVTIAGRSLSQCQLDFALAAGAERVIVLGNGGSADAIALRHAAERAGARFQAIRDGHGLLGAVRAGDELLVLAPGLLPEAPAAIEALHMTNVVLVLPSGAGVAAGFERIDLNRAWAGALVIGGSAIERLAELPADMEPAAALLRIALQNKVAERTLPDSVLTDDSWMMLNAEADLTGYTAAWLQRNLPAVSRNSPSQRLGHWAARHFGPRLIGRSRVVALVLLGSAVLGVGAFALAWSGLAAIGLTLLAIAILLISFETGLSALMRGPFARAIPRWRQIVADLWPVDTALAACAAGAIEGSWLHRAFAPLVFVAALRASRIERWPHQWAMLGDRFLIALLLAFAASFGWLEPVIMIVGLSILTLVIVRADSRGG